MKHKWIKNKSKKPDGMFFNHKVCTVCGCKKCTSKYKGFYTEHYSRSGMTFDYLPDCIDWNSKDDIVMD